MKFKKAKIKNVAYFLVVILIGSSLVTFISVFYNKSFDINAIEDSENDNALEFKNINIASKFENNFYGEQITSYSKSKNQYLFDKQKINSNFFNIVNSILKYDKDFNDDPNDYEKVLRYNILDNQQEIIINLFLYNKLLKSKRFKTFFKLSIT